MTGGRQTTTAGARRRGLRLASLLAAALAAAAGFAMLRGGNEPTPAGEEASPSLVFTGDECVYTGPTELVVPESTRVALTIRNDSDVPAYFDLIAVPEGETIDSLLDAVPRLEEGEPIPAAPSFIAAYRLLGPATEGELVLSSREARAYAPACIPLDGRRGFASERAFRTVEE